MEQKALVLIAQHWPTVAYQTAVGFLRTCFWPGSITVANSMANARGRATRGLLVVLPLAEILVLWVWATIGASGLLSAGRETRAVRVMLVGWVVLLVLSASGRAPPMRDSSAGTTNRWHGAFLALSIPAEMLKQRLAQSALPARPFPGRNPPRQAPKPYGGSQQNRKKGVRHC